MLGGSWWNKNPHIWSALVIEEDGFLNNFDNVQEDYIGSRVESLKPNDLTPPVHDIGLRDDSLDTLHMHLLKGWNLSQCQDRFIRLNELNAQLSLDFFTLDKMKTIGEEHIEKTIKGMIAINRKLQTTFEPQLVPRCFYLFINLTSVLNHSKLDGKLYGENLYKLGFHIQ